MPESEAASLFVLTVRTPLFTDSPDVSEVSAATPSLRFHEIVTPVAVNEILVWSRKITGVNTRFVVAQLGAYS
ncbi:hypothetical protein [Longicatena caecimuris]|uniref:hypothetical protein n=1 Tax=Longicatena caecimuris TaxID=1796635 RepID=UPI003AB2914F